MQGMKEGTCALRLRSRIYQIPYMTIIIYTVRYFLNKILSELVKLSWSIAYKFRHTPVISTNFKLIAHCSLAGWYTLVMNQGNKLLVFETFLHQSVNQEFLFCEHLVIACVRPLPVQSSHRNNDCKPNTKIYF